MFSVLSMLHAHVATVLMTEFWQQSKRKLRWRGGCKPELALVSQCCGEGLGMALFIETLVLGFRTQELITCAVRDSGTETWYFCRLSDGGTVAAHLSSPL